MAEHEYDVIVVGGGSTGENVADRAVKGDCIPRRRSGSTDSDAPLGIRPDSISDCPQSRRVTLPPAPKATTQVKTGSPGAF